MQGNVSSSGSNPRAPSPPAISPSDKPSALSPLKRTQGVSFKRPYLNQPDPTNFLEQFRNLNASETSDPAPMVSRTHVSLKMGVGPAYDVAVIDTWLPAGTPGSDTLTKTVQGPTLARKSNGWARLALRTAAMQRHVSKRVSRNPFLPWSGKGIVKERFGATVVDVVCGTMFFGREIDWPIRGIETATTQKNTQLPTFRVTPFLLLLYLGLHLFS